MPMAFPVMSVVITCLRPKLEIIWLDLSADYLNEGQKVTDLYWLLYYAYYNFSEIYLIAYDE